MIKQEKKFQLSGIKESPLFWPARMTKGVLHVLDETQIPKKLHYVKVRSSKEAVDVIKQMKTRAFGQFLVVLNAFLLELNKDQPKDDKALVKQLEKCAQALNNSRPTFPFSEVTSIVTGWARKALKEGKDVRRFVSKNISGYLEGIRMRRLERVSKIAGVIDNGDSILTHCNVSGELAMAAWLCRKQGKKAHFFATETRPYFQGAKLTAWELKKMGADVTLIADNAAGLLMMDGLVDKVIVGSDRNCANGDFANKIGTYQIAILAREFNVPFYVLTQPSNKIRSGKDIPIEFRNASELLTYERKKIVRGKVDGLYPGFDVVPHSLVTRAIPINVR